MSSEYSNEAIPIKQNLKEYIAHALGLELIQYPVPATMNILMCVFLKISSLII